MARAAKREFSDTVQVTVDRVVTVDKLLRLKVVTPEEVVFEGNARSLVAPAWDGWVGILPGHAPFLTLMGEGPLSVEPESGSRRKFLVGGSPGRAGGSRERTAGVMKVEANEVTVLVDRVDVVPKEIVRDLRAVAEDGWQLEKSGESSG